MRAQPRRLARVPEQAAAVPQKQEPVAPQAERSRDRWCRSRALRRRRRESEPLAPAGPVLRALLLAGRSSNRSSRAALRLRQVPALAPVALREPAARDRSGRPPARRQQAVASEQAPPA